MSPLAAQKIARHPQRYTDDAQERADLLVGQQHISRGVGLGRQSDGDTQPIEQGALGGDYKMKKPDAEEHIEVD